MSALVQVAIIAAALWIASWVVMVLLAKRLAPELLRDAAESRRPRQLHRKPLA